MALVTGRCSHTASCRIHAVYLKWIRTIVANGCWTENMLADNHLLMVWGLPSISLRLAKARLLYAFQLVRHGPREVIDMVTAVHKNPQSWFPASRRALQWLSNRHSSLFDWDPLVATPACIFDWLRDHLDSGPRLVRKAYHSELQQFRLVGRAAQRHLELANCFRDGSVAVPPAPAHVPSALPYECRLCAATFHSLHRLHVHQWLAHELISPERAMMSTTICPACHKCVWSAQRLQQHLRYSRRFPQGCYVQLTWRCAPWSDVPDIDEENMCTTFLRQPATAVAHVPSRLEVEIASREDADRCLQEQWKQEELPLTLDYSTVDQMVSKLDSIVRQWSAPTVGAVDDMLFHLTSCVTPEDIEDEQALQNEWAFCLWVLDYVLGFSAFPWWCFSVLQGFCRKW